MRRWLTLIGAVLAGVLALTACTARAAPTGTADPGVDLTFTVPTLDGKTFHGTSLAGGPALLWFWTPWCSTCAAEAPHVREVADRYAGKITVVGVAGWDELASMHRFVDLTGVGNITNLADTRGVVWQRFGVTELSSYVLLSSGAIVYRGYLDDAGLDAMLARLAG